MAMPENVLERSTSFVPELVTDLVNKVQGKSSLAKLSKQTPLAFNGNREFTFTMDSDVSIVAESGAKSHGGVSIDPVTIVPIKFEYGARVSDEFMISSDEERINILKAFNDGFARKVARGLDLAALHGVNPRTGSASTVVGNNHFDYLVDQVVAYNAADPEGNIEAAVSAIRAAGGDVSGLIMSPTFGGALAALTNGGGGPKLYPQLAWGGTPESLNGMPIDLNRTVSDMNDVDLAIMGDFANMFHWGYAKEIPVEVIRYGDPDNSSADLRGYNQVYIRAEIYLGWGILAPTHFARIAQQPMPADLTLTLTAASTLVGGTKIAVTEETGAANSLFVKINGTLPRLGDIVEDGVAGWSAYTESAEIAVTAGDVVALVEAVTATGAVVKGATIDVPAAKIKTS